MVFMCIRTDAAQIVRAAERQKRNNGITHYSRLCLQHNMVGVSFLFSLLYISWNHLPSPITSAPVFQTTDRICKVGVEVETEEVGVGGGGNNLQMKNNPFRSNAISGRADGQTEQRSCQSAPSLLKQRLRRGEHGRRGESGEGWRDHSKGRGSGWGRSLDIRMMAGGGGLGWWRGWIFCSDIAGLAPSELDIKSPCQVLPTLKDTWH